MCLSSGAKHFAKHFLVCLEIDLPHFSVRLPSGNARSSPACVER